MVFSFWCVHIFSKWPSPHPQNWISFLGLFRIGLMGLVPFFILLEVLLLVFIMRELESFLSLVNLLNSFIRPCLVDLQLSFVLLITIFSLSSGLIYNMSFIKLTFISIWLKKSTQDALNLSLPIKNKWFFFSKIPMQTSLKGLFLLFLREKYLELLDQSSITNE